jgi:hypothetical protein
MALIAKDKGGGDFKPVPVGAHIGICVLVADMGVQPSAKYKPQRKVYIRWELPNESVEWTDRDGKKHTGPMSIGKQYTLSLNEKASLRADLENWRGRTFSEQELQGFDLETILGKPCMLGVTHNTEAGKTYANIGSIMVIPKGTAIPKPSSEPFAYSIEDHDQSKFERLPNWLQEKIKQRVPDGGKTVNETPAGAAVGGDDFDDEIPF